MTSTMASVSGYRSGTLPVLVMRNVHAMGSSVGTSGPDGSSTSSPFVDLSSTTAGVSPKW